MLFSPKATGFNRGHDGILKGYPLYLQNRRFGVTREVQMGAPLHLFDAARRHRRRQTMKRDTLTSPPGFLAALSVVLLSHFVTPVGAQDTIKVAVGQIDAWANQVPTLGMKAGIFQRHGIVLENFGTQGAGETLQAVISGSADIGMGVGTAGAMRAFVKGAPVRVLAAAYTGVEDIYWFVPANSPIKSVKDITDKHTIAYSTNGSTSDSVLRALIAHYGLKAKPTQTGGPPGTTNHTRTDARQRRTVHAASNCACRNCQCACVEGSP
jgi:ABC-type nitrate/sulfonate/bicarbonate transport system substrate-binding protein